MFGQYDIPVNVETGGCAIRVTEHEGAFLYHREAGGETAQKWILADRCRLLVNPVEPVNRPNELTQLLFIEFEKQVLVEPKGKKTVFLTFPVEVGVFVSKTGEGGDEGELEVIDGFTLAGQKLTLYGDPDNGQICRYWMSRVFPSMPETDPLREGVMEIEISNGTDKWAEVAKTVLSAPHMKLYFSDRLVSMKVRMTITGEKSAETAFTDKPVEQGMQKSVELYRVRKMAVLSTAFTMEHGL